MLLHVIIKKGHSEDKKSIVQVFDESAKLHFKSEGEVNQSILLEQLQVCQHSYSSLPETLKEIVTPNELNNTRIFYKNLDLGNISKVKLRNATCQFLKQLDELVIKETGK